MECGFTLKCVRDMIRRYSQMQRINKYPEHSSTIWQVWPNYLVFVYELSGCRLEFCYSYLTFSYRAYFEQGVP